jgi:ribonuclease HII
MRLSCLLPDVVRLQGWLRAPVLWLLPCARLRAKLYEAQYSSFGRLVRIRSVGDSELQVSAATLKLRMLKRLRCGLRHEKRVWQRGAQRIAGVDEAGRGALFGPVVAASVILDPEKRIRGLRDSKLLDEAERERLAELIRKHALAWAFASVDAEEIDRINIYQASRAAMLQAVVQLSPPPDHLLVDAMQLACECPQTSIIHGDAVSASIAAASIIAKVERDRMMREFDAVFPAYGLTCHKGYGTPQHLAALREHGPTLLHRRSFAPVWEVLPHPQTDFAFMELDGSLEEALHDLCAEAHPGKA